ncbi:MAG: MFS transporter, partial [Geminicoccaceae bacterium]
MPRFRLSERGDLLSAPATDAPSSTYWPTVLTAIGLGWLSAVAVGKMPPALPLLRADLGLGLVAAGWLTSLIGLTGAFGAIAAGALSSRSRPVPILAAALGCLALGALLGASGWVWLLFLGRLLQSAGFIVVIVTAPRLIAGAVAQRHR